MNIDINAEEKKRYELLKEAGRIVFAAFLTALTSEYCFELITLNTKGTSYQWIGYDEWTVFKLEPCDKEKWAEIRSKIREEMLFYSDLEGTQFKDLVDSTIGDSSTVDYSSMFSSLLYLSDLCNSSLFCYYDSDEHSFSFTTNQNDLKTLLASVYPADTEWSELETTELEGWLERYQEEGQEIPCIYFENTNG